MNFKGIREKRIIIISPAPKTIVDWRGHLDSWISFYLSFAFTNTPLHLLPILKNIYSRLCFISYSPFFQYGISFSFRIMCSFGVRILNRTELLISSNYDEVSYIFGRVFIYFPKGNEAFIFYLPFLILPCIYHWCMYSYMSASSRNNDFWILFSTVFSFRDLKTCLWVWPDLRF